MRISMHTSLQQYLGLLCSCHAGPCLSSHERVKGSGTDFRRKEAAVKSQKNGDCAKLRRKCGPASECKRPELAHSTTGVTDTVGGWLGWNLGRVEVEGWNGMAFWAVQVLWGWLGSAGCWVFSRG